MLYLETVFVKIIHIFPPYFGMLLIYEVLSELLVNEFLPNVLHLSIMSLLTKFPIVEAITFRTTFALHSGIIYAQIN
jgi:hypothetical protein